MPRRKANGEGTIYLRKDGRWAAAAFVDTTAGTRKRIHVLGRSRQEVHDKLEDKLAQARKGIRTPNKEWTVGAYLDYWLNTVVAAKNRPRTIELYEATIRLHLTSTLGSIRLTKLTVQDVQSLLNQQLAQGRSLRSVHQVRSVLRAALSRAEREELVVRNVAKLVDIRAWKRKPIQPWTSEEAARFLDTAKHHRWYPAYVMLLVYGMRRGEVLGLRWCDVDLARNQLRIRQQLQRVGKTLEQGPVKTDAGQRDLPLVPVLRDALIDHYVRRYGDQPDTAVIADQAAIDRDLVFLSSAATPIDPKNFVRTFHEIRERAGLPRITVHHTRHTAATMLKNLGVPARDAQLILGHAHVTTTQQLYQHADMGGQTRALQQIGEQLLTGDVAVSAAVKSQFSTGQGTEIDALTPGGPGGARTLDTLLKRHILTEVILAATPNLGLVRARAYAHIFGWVAVNYCCQTSHAHDHDGTRVLDWVFILHALRNVETQLMATRSFPRSLLPPRPLAPPSERKESSAYDKRLR